MIAKPSEIKSAFDKFVRLEAAAAPALAEKIEPAPMPIRARLNYTSVGVCPYCSKPMGRVVCCEQEVFLCESDRFVSPLPNAELPV